MIKKLTHTPGKFVRIIIFFAFVFFLIPLISFEQCSVTISSFPYNENFETSNGNWITGGNSSDWAWGTPSKLVINSAGTGSKCWITGGLNNKSYNGGENSWLKTPCFNFTNLKNPYLKFKVFWETATKNDGANLQYSTNNGVTWQLLGGKNETDNCLSENWYNSSSVVNLSNQDAWSGNIQSSRPGCFVAGGSANWVTAKHSISNLAGEPNVTFRFVFGSGTSCNNFDGFAIDDFTIEEGPGSVASFRYTCSSNLRVNFISTSTLCPTSYLWNFGDPFSAENTSNLPNPTHAYTVGGKYKVSLTVSGPGNTSSTFMLPDLEIIENILAIVVNPIRCNGDTTGSLTVNFEGDSSGINFLWDTKPVQTSRTAVNLGAGNYNITILNDEGCPASAKVTLIEPPPMLYTINTVKPDCSVNNGSINIAMSGGSPPYSYTWSPNVSNTSFAKNLVSQTYTVTVTDNNLCNKIIKIDLPGLGDLKAEISNSKNVSCFSKNDGMALVTATDGNKPYIYSWSSGGNAAMENNLAAGSYTATVTDTKGCKAFATAVINQPEVITSIMKLQNTSCGNSNGNAKVEVFGGTKPYELMWSPVNKTSDSISNLAPGEYTVTIKDNNGCIKNDTAIIAPSSAINLQLSHTDILCSGELTGMAKAVVTGGTAPYNFQWTDGTQIFNADAISNVPAGTYNVSVQDGTGCSVKASVIITQPEPLNVALVTEPSYCDLNNGSANATVSGGVPPYAFSWLPSGNTASTLTNVPAGNYQLTVTDKNNCTISLLTTVPDEKPSNIFLGNDTTLCPGSKIILSPGIFSSYRWQDNSANPDFTVTNEGIYTVQVTDDRGCVLKDTIKIIADCGFIFFPTAFTPNNDGRNDFFGPFGNLTTVKDYTLLIYDRWGKVVFKSNDPFKKWNGKVKDNDPQMGTYVWIARFTNKGETNIEKKGTVTIVN